MFRNLMGWFGIFFGLVLLGGCGNGDGMRASLRDPSKGVRSANGIRRNHLGPTRGSSKPKSLKTYNGPAHD